MKTLADVEEWNDDLDSDSDYPIPPLEEHGGPHPQDGVDKTTGQNTLLGGEAGAPANGAPRLV
jgi:hypothetical protein